VSGKFLEISSKFSDFKISAKLPKIILRNLNKILMAMSGILKILCHDNKTYKLTGQNLTL